MKKIMGFVVTLFLFSVFYVSFAGAARYDYGDAINYGVATHTTPEWQRLGVGWDNEGVQQNPDQFDDGVMWSTDDGATWNVWGNDTLDLKQGDSVKFQFTFTRALYGNHPYDDLRSWIDWNGDGVWSDNEEIYYNRIDKGATQIDDQEYFDNGGSQYDSETMIFTSDNILVSGLFTGTTWLRARVSCSESITSYNNSNGLDFDAKISATGYLWQGEAEDYRVNVAPVPVPGAVWLLGSGLLGLLGVRRRNRC